MTVINKEFSQWALDKFDQGHKLAKMAWVARQPEIDQLNRIIRLQKDLIKLQDESLTLLTTILEKSKL